MSKKLLVGLILIIVAGCCFACWAHTSKILLRAKPDLLVEVNWVARDQEGILLDTNICEVAREEGLTLKAEEFYKPLRFEVGKGPVKGIDKGVLGMRIGDEKTVRIPPEKGFAGMRAFAWLDREEEIPTLETFPREELEKRLGIGKYKLGQILPHYLGGWRVVITELTPENVTIRSSIIRGRYSWQMFPGWNVTVLEVTPEEIVLRHEPKPGLVFKAQEGGFPFLEPLIYKVEEVSEQKIKLIYNPYESIANKTLEVGLTVVDIEKSGSGKES